jgi:hypothetical protein
VSAIRSFFILKSKGVSVAKLGVWFISISHGFNFSSINMSKPKISKHMDFRVSLVGPKYWALFGIYK